MRERLVSAAAFAVAATVASMLLLSGFGLSDGLALPYSWWDSASAAAPAATIGFLAGPHVARAPDGLAAAIVGIAVTAASVLLYAIAIDGVAFVQDGAPWDLSLRPYLTYAVSAVGFSLVAGLVAAPFGALGAFVAWRWLRRDTRTDCAVN
jgi:hypothetical protein